jgi:hypothetical protein
MAIHRAIAVLLLASGALFAVGSQIERNSETPAEAKASPVELRRDATRSNDAGTTSRSETGGESRTASRPAEGAKDAGAATTHESEEIAGTKGSTETTTEGTSATGERVRKTSIPNGGAPTGHSSAETPAEHRAELHREAKLFGINPEAVGLVIATVVASLLLAIVVWMRPRDIVLITVVGFGLVFAGFDVREVLHQIDESRAGLIAIAGVLAILHLLVAALAGAELMGSRTPHPAPA